MRQINTRADLEILRGTQEFAGLMQELAGSMSIKVNTAIYPDDYNDPDYGGPEVPPVWEDREDLTTIERMGYTRAEVLSAL